MEHQRVSLVEVFKEQIILSKYQGRTTFGIKVDVKPTHTSQIDNLPSLSSMAKCPNLSDRTQPFAHTANWMCSIDRTYDMPARRKGKLDRLTVYTAFFKLPLPSENQKDRHKEQLFYEDCIDLPQVMKKRYIAKLAFFFGCTNEAGLFKGLKGDLSTERVKKEDFSRHRNALLPALQVFAKQRFRDVPCRCRC